MALRTAIDSDLLLRLMNATPEQYAAVERILSAGVVSAPVPLSEDVARSAFALLQKLEMDAPLKAPSALTVFRLYCVDGYSADAVARRCRCAKGTVMSRLRFIERATKTKPEQFRTMSAHLQRMDDDLRSSGAREIYRRGLVDEAESD